MPFIQSKFKTGDRVHCGVFSDDICIYAGLEIDDLHKIFVLKFCENEELGDNWKAVPIMVKENEIELI